MGVVIAAAAGAVVAICRISVVVGCATPFVVADVVVVADAAAADVEEELFTLKKRNIDVSELRRPPCRDDGEPPPASL